jgi:choline dehydrogenase-like flavoprotein
MSRILIVGSGLSAASAASALVARGLRPTLVDVGLPPDPEAVELKNELAGTPPTRWRSDSLDRIRGMDAPSACGIPRKRWFGSDFPFRSLPDDWDLQAVDVSMVRSYAEGGLSNVWGAALQRVTAQQIADWPISLEELDPHYDSALAFMTLHGSGDGASAARPKTDLEKNAPLLRPSLQARAFLSDLERHRAELAQRGITFQPSQLAVQKEDHQETGCRYCGLCLFGCPFDCIYSASHTIRRLVSLGRVDYIPGTFIQTIEQKGGRTVVRAWNLRENRPEVMEASVVLIGAGVLSTARILLESLRCYGKALTIRHSDMFTLPFLRFQGAEGVSREALHTLCQVFIELHDDRICRQSVHLQVYTYNDLYLPLILKKLGAFGSLLRCPIRKVVERLLMVFGYLPSDISSTVEVMLDPSRDHRVLLRGNRDVRSAKACEKAARRLLRDWRAFGGIPLTFHRAVDAPGGGYHSGGSLPMSRHGRFPSTDLLGRVPQFEHVHVIDASVFPTIPAVPTAFTVMANAHRIAALCAIPE